MGPTIRYQLLPDSWAQGKDIQCFNETCFLAEGYKLLL